MKTEARAILRVAAPALGIAALLVGSAAASRSLTTTEEHAEPPADVVDVSLGEVRRIAVQSADRQVELARTSDGTWTAGAGVSWEAEALMPDIEERLFPLRAYRALRAETPSPEFGLADPEIAFRIEDRNGNQHEVLLGQPTFTNGGVYARRSSEPGRLYLIPRRMMDDLRSLLAGERIDTPNDLPEKLQENTPKHDPTSWWLRQVEDAAARASGGQP